MRRSTLVTALATALLFTFAHGVSGQGVNIGSKVENFSLSDTGGKVRSRAELTGKNGAVVIFLSAQCPVVRGYVDRINQLAAEYGAKGIDFIGINSNATEDLNWVKSNIAEYGYKFPVLIDKGNVLADTLDAQATPEVYFLDSKGVLLYRGAIDNDKSGKNITESYLKTALDSTLAGRSIERTNARAFGCSIQRVTN
jgi:peroxiredoxin